MSWSSTEAMPPLSARPRMLACRGPVKVSGNSVSTSMRMGLEYLLSSSQTNGRIGEDLLLAGACGTQDGDDLGESTRSGVGKRGHPPAVGEVDVGVVLDQQPDRL